MVVDIVNPIKTKQVQQIPAKHHTKSPGPVLMDMHITTSKGGKRRKAIHESYGSFTKIVLKQKFIDPKAMYLS